LAEFQISSYCSITLARPLVTSTTARRAGTTESGSNEALRMRALPKVVHSWVKTINT
jgi:hypothetical protein